MWAEHGFDSHTLHHFKMKLKFKYDDGGRKYAGFAEPKVGDCVVRAISIAFDKSYLEVYEFVNIISSKEKKRKSYSKKGIYLDTIKKVMKRYGATWISYMKTKKRIRMNSKDLPMKGKYVLNLSKHVVAIIDGTIHDLYDCSENGNRIVYGCWKINK